MEKIKRERHGMRWTPMYMVWIQMKARCSCKTNKQYSDYGGRGIYVCDRWKYSFINFYNDMVDQYREGLDIDRINNDGPYSKKNCRWTNRNTNCANRRSFGRFLKGVVGKTKGGKFISRITIDSKKYSLGCFDSEIEAHEAFLKIHKEWYGF